MINSFNFRVFSTISTHQDHQGLQQIRVDSDDGCAKWKRTFHRCLQSLKPWSWNVRSSRSSPSKALWVDETIYFLTDSGVLTNENRLNSWIWTNLSPKLFRFRLCVNENWQFKFVAFSCLLFHSYNGNSWQSSRRITAAILRSDCAALIKYSRRAVWWTWKHTSCHWS